MLAIGALCIVASGLLVSRAASQRGRHTVYLPVLPDGAGERIAEVAAGRTASASGFWRYGTTDSFPPSAIVDRRTVELHCGLGVEEGNSYWLLPDGATGWAQVDLGRQHRIVRLRWLNTHNGDCLDRATTEFRVAVSDSGAFAGEEVVVRRGTMVFSSAPHFEAAVLDEPVTARYIRFYVDAFHGAGGGLNELEVYALASGPEPTVDPTRLAWPTITPAPVTPTRVRPTVPPNPTRSAERPAPYLEYRVYRGEVITDEVLPPVRSGGDGDYGAIFERHRICDLVQAGAIDEVWIWAGNGDGVVRPHLLEWTTSGPGWAGRTPDCGKVVTTMVFNYLREVDVALESYHHRLEGAFTTYFPCDLSTATWPWRGASVSPYRECGEDLSDRYGLVARPFAGNDHVAACGDAHHPPNVTSARDYVYGSPQRVLTICPDWAQDGSSVPVEIDCTAWGCSHWGFHLWWMQNVPGPGNRNRTRDGAAHVNWWSYLFGVPDDAPPTPTAPSPAGAAMTSRTVYVIHYPAYGGAPRAPIPALTAELVDLLREGTVYHGYAYDRLRAEFIGQDGASHAGRDCNPGDAPDNVHFRLTGLREDAAIAAIRLDDPAGGTWTHPCVSSWMLHAERTASDRIEVYAKPFRDAPSGTIYGLSVRYADASTEVASVVGGEVRTQVRSTR